MSAAAFLRVKKLKGGGIVLAAARHTLREIQAELGAGGTIDPTRMGMNVVMHGPGDAADVRVLRTRGENAPQDAGRWSALLPMRAERPVRSDQPGSPGWPPRAPRCRRSH